MKFDEDTWYPRSQELPAKFEKGETFLVQNVDPQKSKISKSSQQGFGVGINASLPSNLVKKRK